MKGNRPKPQPKPFPWPVLGLCVFLVVAVFVVFGQTRHFQFVNYDDQENVYANPVVTRGLSVQAIGWAFTHAQTWNWIPLTTIAHMVDCQLFGLDAGAHHLVNVLWHAANAVLVFLVLRQMTGNFWRSAFVALIFAVHPLRVESVAWVSERKDVLSGFFFLLALSCYVRYVRKPSVGIYVLLTVLFVLGLLAKTMVATLPFVLLLLDYWPLRRFEGWPRFGVLVREKVPLFALSAAGCVAAAVVPGFVVTDSHRVSLFERVGNAFLSYVIYLRQMFFPVGLAPLYPVAANEHLVLKTGLAVALLAAISTVAIVWRKERPFLVTGWLWYLGMLFPVIGIIQISGNAAHADRYTYLSQIGIAFAVTWAVTDWASRWKHGRLVLGCVTAAAIGASTVCAQRQVSYWSNGETLWTRELACVPGNSTAHVYLGAALAAQGKPALAIDQYQAALAGAPDNVAALNNLGTLLAGNGDVAKALDCFRRALQVEPASKVTHYNLGVTLAGNGQTEEAAAQYREALAADPNFADAHLSLGNTLRKLGHLDESITHLRQAIKLRPDDSAAYSSLGLTFLQQGKASEAIEAWKKSLAIKPEQADVQNNLAWLLATSPDSSLRDGATAVTLAERANHASGGGNMMILRTLAAAYAEQGRFADASAAARRAIDLAIAQKNQPLTLAMERELKLYETQQPVREALK